MAKKCDKAAREGEEKPCGGAASDAAHDKLRHKAATSSAPTPLSNQMIDSLEGYLNNIDAAATQAAATGGPLAELSVSLAVSVDKVAAQENDIESMHQ